MTVIEVSKEHHLKLAGLPWKKALSDLHNVQAKTVEVNYGTMNRLREGHEPTGGNTGFLPVNHVWLREVDGRAFLYLDNS